MADDSNPRLIVAAGAIRPVDPLVARFRQDHPDWPDDASPQYCLPLEVVDCLKNSLERAPPILSSAAAQLEAAFTILCSRLEAVGLWHGTTVSFRLLRKPTPPPSRAEMKRLEYSSQQILETERLIKRSTEMLSRLKGYVGWLTVDPEFRSARDKLAAQWDSLNQSEKPPLPLTRSIRLPNAGPEVHEVSEPAALFQRDFNAFLDHWGLACMASWELPEPQGPLIPAYLPIGAPAMPKHGLHIVLPIHFPLTGADSLLSEIHRQQIILAEKTGLSTSIAGLPHHEVYSRMLEVHHLEFTIRSRYGRPGQRGGFVTLLESAIAKGLTIDVASVQRLRKGISACLRGKRNSIRWLR